MSEVTLLGLRCAVFAILMLVYLQLLIVSEHLFNLMQPQYYVDRVGLTCLALPFAIFGCRLLVSDKFIATNTVRLDHAFEASVEGFFVGIGNVFSAIWKFFSKK